MPSNGLMPFLQRNRNFLLVVIGLPTLVAALISVLLPGYYLSTTTAIPANSRLTDVNRFNANNARELYPVFGEADDLDRIQNICRSAGISGSLVKDFDLVAHYGLNATKTDASSQAMKKLMKNTEIEKTETGELRVRVWDRSPELAAKIANAYLTRTDSIYRRLTRSVHADALAGLGYSISNMSDSSRMDLSETVPLLANEAASSLRIAKQSAPPALVVIDAAYPSLKPDRPDILRNTLATLLVGAFTALTALLFFSPDRNRD